MFILKTLTIQMDKIGSQLPNELPHWQISDPFVVRSATMAEKRRGPPSRGKPYIWPPRITDAEAAEADAMAERRRRVEDMTTAVDILIKYQKTYNKKYTQEEADDLVQKALMRDRAETLQLYFEMLPEVADGGMFVYYSGMLFVAKVFLSPEPVVDTALKGRGSL